MKVAYQPLFDFAEEFKLSGDIVPQGIECPAYSLFQEGEVSAGHCDTLRVWLTMISYGEKIEILKEYNCRFIGIVLGIALEGLIVKDNNAVDGRRLANSKEFIFIEEEKCLQT